MADSLAVLGDEWTLTDVVDGRTLVLPVGDGLGVDGGSFIVVKGGLCVEVDLWVVEVGLWVVEVGFGVVEVGFWVVEVGLWVVEVDCWVVTVELGFKVCVVDTRTVLLMDVELSLDIVLPVVLTGGIMVEFTLADTTVVPGMAVAL